MDVIYQKSQCSQACEHRLMLKELLPVLTPLLNDILLSSAVKSEHLPDRIVNLAAKAQQTLDLLSCAREYAAPHTDPGTPASLVDSEGPIVLEEFSNSERAVSPEIAWDIDTQKKEKNDIDSELLHQAREVDLLNIQALDMSKVVKDIVSLQFDWKEPPKKALVVKKWNSPQICIHMKNILLYLENLHISTVIEPSVFEDKKLFVEDTFKYTQLFDKNDEKQKRSIDFIVCLGGDGLILYVSSMFQKYSPPILSFHLGTLGFLTPFEIRNFKKYINQVLTGGFPITLRMRLECSIERGNRPIIAGNLPESHFTRANTGETISDNYVVLNEVVIDRGPSPFLGTLDLYVGSRHITSIQADGVIVATPTGSTAYSLSAGGAMAHPNVPGILVTPICPHTLSFRPLILPASATLKIVVQEGSRNHSAWVSCDGRNRQQINQGDTLNITCSPYYVPTVSKISQSHDWFDSLNRCLSWNVRGHMRDHDDYSEDASCISEIS